MNLFCIPSALQIDMDDMGWFCGKDERKTGGPSRTGVSRRHCALDYLAVNELGRRLNMRINCAFVVGEWDSDNSLRAIPHLSQYGDAWDNAAYYNEAEMRACVDAINQSPYINLCVHGLLHGYYKKEADWHDSSDFYYRIKNVLHMIPEGEVRERLDAFFRLLSVHGVKKTVNTFIPPSFAYRFDEIAPILRDYGIDYVGTIFKTAEYREKAPTEPIEIEECGMVTYDRHHNPIPWDSFGADWDALPPLCGLVGVHWPNFLHADPMKNLESVDAAEAYFRRAAEAFGTILSRGVEFYASQMLYKRYATVGQGDGVMTVDLAALPKTSAVRDRFYISAKRPIAACDGCAVSVYEQIGDFMTYEVIPLSKKMTIRAKI